MPSESTEDNGSKFSQGFRHFPDSETLLTFANGTTKSVLGYATLESGAPDFTGVVDGQSFFNKFCSGNAAAPSSSASSSPSSTVIGSPSVAAASSAPPTTNNLFTPLASPTGVAKLEHYPEAAVMCPDTSIGGYFPAGQKDLAVVSVPSFEPKAAECEYCSR